MEPSNPDEAVQTEVHSGLDPSRFGEQALVSSQAEDNASAAFSERSRHPTDGSGASLPLYQGTNWFSPPARHSPTSGSTTPRESRVPAQLPDRHLGTPRRQHNDASGYMKQAVLLSAERSVRTTTARRFLHRRASPQQCQSSLHGARGFTWNNARSSQARSSHTPLRSNAVTQTVPFHVKHGSFTLSGREVGAETVSVSAPKASFSHSTSATPRRATSPAPAPRRCGRGPRPRRIRS